MRRAFSIAGFALVFALALAPAGALADGDPASDVLIGQDTFLPFQPKVSSGASADLKKVVAASKRAGAPLKVAIIGTSSDLGAVPDFFGRPQEYAKFLGNEMRLILPKQRFTLLVVMPAGFGVAGRVTGARAQSSLRGIELGASSSGDELALAAALGGQRLAAVEGHPFKAIVTAQRAGGGGHGGRIAVIAIELGLLLAGVGGAMGLRRRAAPPPAATA